MLVGDEDETDNEVEIDCGELWFWLEVESPLEELGCDDEPTLVEVVLFNPAPFWSVADELS